MKGNTNMKKMLLMLTAVLMLISCIGIPVAAANDGVIKVGRTSADLGDEISIPVTYENNPGVYIIRLIVEYDSQILDYVTVEKSASRNFNYTINSTEQGIVVLMDCPSFSNVTDDFELFKLTFKVKENAAPGRTLINVVCEDGMASALEKKDGKYTVTSLHPATSTGAVVVLCNDHAFSTQQSDGSFKCTKCGAVKNVSGEVSADANQGLPEINPSESGAGNTEPSVSDDISSDSDQGNEDDGVKFGHFIPIIVAVAVAIPLIVSLILAKNKKKK